MQPGLSVCRTARETKHPQLLLTASCPLAAKEARPYSSRRSTVEACSIEAARFRLLLELTDVLDSRAIETRRWNTGNRIEFKFLTTDGHRARDVNKVVVDPCRTSFGLQYQCGLDGGECRGGEAGDNDANGAR